MTPIDYNNLSYIMYEVWEPYVSFLEVGAMYVWKERTQERKRNGKGIRIFSKRVAQSLARCDHKFPILRRAGPTGFDVLV